MRLCLVSLLCCLLLTVTACDGPPPTQIVLVVTATPDANPTVSPEVPATDTITAATSGAATSAPTVVSASPTPTATIAPTATPNIFPTPTVGNIQIAEQLFQGGRMFWVEPTRQIWVLIVTGEGRGSWTIYPDAYEDGIDPEVDTTIVPPEGLLQPQRGFGKLWRQNADVREGLGWATTPEFGYVSPYEYHPGGTIDRQGRYQSAPGYHILYSLYQEQFRFNEVDGTWQLGSG